MRLFAPALLALLPLAACAHEGSPYDVRSASYHAPRPASHDDGRSYYRDCSNGGYGCTGGDRYQYIPGYHPYSQQMQPPRRGYGPEGLDPNRLVNRNQPGTYRRRYGGPEGLDPNRLVNRDQPGTYTRQPVGQEGLDPGTLVNDYRAPRNRDRPTYREGLDPDDLVNRNQQRGRAEPRNSSPLDRCMLHPSNPMYAEDPRCR
jgi:hypothetical protein